MSEVIDDLNNMLLEGDKKLQVEVLETSEPLESLEETTSQIDLLDVEVNEPGRTPNVILDEYTQVHNDTKAVELAIEQFKQAHPDIFNEYQALLDKIEANSTKQAELKTEMTTSMEASKLKTISNESFKVTFVAATTKSTFDRKKFEAKYPVLCQQFLKTSDVSAYVKIAEVKK